MGHGDEAGFNCAGVARDRPDELTHLPIWERNPCESVFGADRPEFLARKSL
jgi:hypothetical protein